MLYDYVCVQEADPLAGYKAVVPRRFSINSFHPFLLAGRRRCLKLARAEVSEVSEVSRVRLRPIPVRLKQTARSY